MAELFTVQEVLARLPRLTEPRLSHLVATRIVLPLSGARGMSFRQVDLARLELLCDLSDEFGLDDDALGLVISLVDQLHAARRDLRAICTALTDEPVEIRARIGARLG